MATSLPSQRIPDSEKTEEWFTNCHKAIEGKLLINSSSNVLSAYNKYRSNRLLFSYNIVSKIDVLAMLDPENVDSLKDIPANYKNYPVTNAHIMTLKGEELKQLFNWSVMVTSRDAISQREKEKNDTVDKFLLDQLTNDITDKKELEQVTQDFMEKIESFQDKREQGAWQLLKYYWNSMELKEKFSLCWDKELIEGKVIVSIDEHNNKPCITIFNPENVYCLKPIDTPFIDDPEQVITREYLPVSQVIDRYYSFLEEEDIEYLESRGNMESEIPYNNLSPTAFYTQAITPDNQITFVPLTEQELTGNADYYQNNYYGNFNPEGEVLVTHTRWKGVRRLAILTYFDEDGEEQTAKVPDNYKANISKGETIKYEYITEAYESTCLAGKVYTKQQVRNVQFRERDNISACHLGILGIEFDQSIYDLMKRYQLLINGYMWRLEEAFQKTLGNIGFLDLALIPDGWEVEKFMYYARKMGWAVIDSFKEGKKGASMGKIAGQNSGMQRGINIEQYEYITKTMEMLNYLQQQLDGVVGINYQRRGQVDQSAGLGVTQEARQASSNITEYYFNAHDQLRLKVLRKLLEVGKFCLRNGSETLPYVTSDQTIATFNLDGEFINEADYNVLVVDSINDAETLNMLREGVKISLQTGQVDLVQMLDVFANNSAAAIKTKVKNSIKDKQRQQQAAEQAQQEHEEKLLQMQLQERELDRQLERYKIDETNRTGLIKAQIGVYTRQLELDQDMDGTPDPAEIAAQGLAQQDLAQKSFQHEREMILKQTELKSKTNLENKKINTQKEIETAKLRQIEVQNKNQIELANKKAKLDKEMMAEKLKIERIKARRKPAKS